MFRVFLVDDEIAAREEIRASVPWAELGLELAGETADGELALSMLREVKPDLLVTDIRMPYMDGLELSRRVRREMPDVRIVIVSAHAGADSLRAAVELGADAFLPKPMDAAALRAALARIAAELTQARARRERDAALGEYLAASGRYLRERLLEELYMGADAGSVLRSARAVHMNLEAKRYRVLLMRPEPQPGEAGLSALHAALERLAANCGDSAFPQRSGAEFSLLVLGDGAEDLEARAEELAAAARRAAEAAAGRGALAVAQGTDVERLADVPLSFAAARARLHREARSAAPAEPIRTPGFDLPPLDEELRYAAPADACAIVTRRAEALGAQNSQALTAYLYVDVLLAAARIVRNSGGEPPEIVPDGLRARGGGDLLLPLCGDALRQALEFRESHTASRRGGAIRKACAYIDAHFSDPNLALREVAGHVALSNNHFCTVFAREMGVTFSAYLTGLRMRRAQQLLRDTNLRTGEIAYAVGYNDPHYFSQLFKKNTGTSPRDYRREGRSAPAETGK